MQEHAAAAEDLHDEAQDAGPRAVVPSHQTLTKYNLET